MDKQDEIRQGIARRLRAAREYRGLTGSELADRSGLTGGRIERLELTGNLTCDELEGIAAALSLPVSHFLESCSVCGSE